MFNIKKPQTNTVIRPSVPVRPVTRMPVQRTTVNTGQKPQNKAIISKQCHIKGDITGNDDISIFGKVEGTISIKDNTVTIEKSAKIDANIFAKVVNINGNIVGNIEASEKIVVADGGNVTGDMVAKKVILQDGSYFKGNVSMVDNQPSQTIPKTK